MSKSRTPDGWEYLATYQTVEAATAAVTDRSRRAKVRWDYTVRETEAGSVNLYRRRIEESRG